MMFALSFYDNKKTMDKRKKHDYRNVTIMIFEDGKGTVFLVKLKLEGKSFERDL